MDDEPIILASSSPQRQNLLLQLNLKHQVIAPNIDETPIADETVECYVKRMCTTKARKVWQLSEKSKPVLSADTCMQLDGKLIGKPESEQHAIDILRKLSGRKHRVISGMVLIGYDADPIGGSRYKEATGLNYTTVEFNRLSDAQIRSYCRTGEPFGKAGAYAIQGMGAAFVRHISGSYSAVMGLPLFELTQLLESFNIDVFSYLSTDKHVKITD